MKCCTFPPRQTGRPCSSSHAPEDLSYYSQVPRALCNNRSGRLLLRGGRQAEQGGHQAQVSMQTLSSGGDHYQHDPLICEQLVDTVSIICTRQSESEESTGSYELIAGRAKGPRRDVVWSDVQIN